jgi:hypothetical protein
MCDATTDPITYANNRSIETDEDVDNLQDSVHNYIDKLHDAAWQSGMFIESFSFFVPKLAKDKVPALVNEISQIPAVTAVEYQPENSLSPQRLKIFVSIEPVLQVTLMPPPPLPEAVKPKAEEEDKSASEKVGEATKKYVDEMIQKLCDRLGVPPERPRTKKYDDSEFDVNAWAQNAPCKQPTAVLPSGIASYLNTRSTPSTEIEEPKPPGGVSLMTDEPRQTMRDLMQELDERAKSLPAPESTSPPTDDGFGWGRPVTYELD